MNKTILILGIIFMLVGISLNPTIAVFNSNDDTTPPVTTHSLDPPTPDGDNGWYISDVFVTLNATDDISGVKEIKYKVNNGTTHTITGDNGTFIVDSDRDNLPIEYWAIDNVGNEEIHHIFVIDMDQSEPVVDLSVDWKIIDEENDTYLFEFNATATDTTSGMNRTEFYLNGVLQETVYGPGPNYVWEMIIDYDYSVWGKIFKRTITDEYIRFFAISVIVEYGPQLWMDFSVYTYDNAGNSAYDELLYMPDYEDIELKWFTFTNDYRGYIGKFNIHAYFDKYPISITPFTNVLNFQINPIFLRFLDHFPLLHRLLDIWRNVLV